MSFAFGVGAGTVLGWLVLATFAFRYRPPRPLWPIAFWFSLAGLCWSSGELWATFLAETPESHWASLLVLYVGVVSIGPLWWALILAFTAQHDARPTWASQKVQYMPLALSGFSWLALFSNPWHGAFIEPVLDGRNEYGWLWYFQAAYSYACLLGAFGVIRWARAKQKDSDRARGQLDALSVVSLLPLVTNFLYVTRLIDIRFDPTIAAFGFGLVLSLTGLSRRGLFGMSGLTLEQWLDHEPDGLAIVDGEGRLSIANPSAARLLGVRRLALETDLVELLGERLCFADPPYVPVGRQRLWARWTGADVSVDGELFRVVDGPCSWLRLKATWIPARWPSRGGFAVSLRDESRLQRADDRASRQAASIEAILGSIQDGLFVADESGNLLYCNERFREYWELPAVGGPSTGEAELLGSLFERVEHPDELTSLWTQDAGSVVKGVAVKLKSGRVLSVTIAPLLRGAVPAGRVWAFRDITDLEQAEVERQRMEERVRESQKLESLGVLAGGVAHDFNNILVGIIGNVELAQAQVNLRSTVFQHLKRVRRSSDRAAELIRQLMAYAGKGRFTSRTLDLSVLVRETLELVRSVISKKAVLAVDLAPGRFVSGDAVQIRQIVMNLVTNASDALERRDGTIAIRTALVRVDADSLSEALPRTEPVGGEFVSLQISDSGCGMSPSKLSRIFDPFFSAKPEGRGLGLAAVLGIVRRHRGFIKVRSVPGNGTTFELLFPKVESSPSVARTSFSGSTSQAAVSATVLVVDDEESVREVAQAAIEAAGLRVLSARDGEEGVALYRGIAGEIDAVLLDLTMPRMDGAETLFAIRQISRTVPIVLTSGYSEADSMARTSGLAGVSFIQKPYTASRLVAKLQEAIRASREGRSEARSEQPARR